MENKNLTVKRIVLYLVITFVLTYALEIFVIAPFVGSADINEALIAQNLTACAMFMPALAVVLTRLLTKEGFHLEELYLAVNIKKNLKYFALAWFGMAFLVVVGGALYFLIFPKQFDANLSYLGAVLQAQAQVEASVPELQAMMVSQILMGIFLSPFINAVNCFGEEWGWRGYLLPKMMERFSIVPTLLISGVIWGLWHAPLTAMGHNYGLGYRGYPVTGIPAIMAHGLINGFASIGVYFTSLENPYNVFLGPAPTGFIGLIGFAVLAAYLLLKMYKEETAKKSEKTV